MSSPNGIRFRLHAKSTSVNSSFEHRVTWFNAFNGLTFKIKAKNVFDRVVRRGYERESVSRRFANVEKVTACRAIEGR